MKSIKDDCTGGNVMRKKVGELFGMPVYETDAIVPDIVFGPMARWPSGRPKAKKPKANP